MKMKMTIELPKGTGIINTLDMKIGEIGKIIDGLYKGSTILCTYSGFVSLTNPHMTWDKQFEIGIELLPAGTRIILEIEQDQVAAQMEINSRLDACSAGF